MAYGVNAPFGLRPIARLGSGTLTSQMNKYNLYVLRDTAGKWTVGYRNDLFTGDPVVLSTAFIPALQRTSSNPGPTIARYEGDWAQAEDGTIGDNAKRPIVGVFQGCEWIDPKGKLQKSPYWPAGTSIKEGTQPVAYVIDDPNALFDVQVSSADFSPKGAAFPYFNNAAVGEGLKRSLTVGLNAALSTISNIWNPAETVTINPPKGNFETGQSNFYLTPVSPYVHPSGGGEQLMKDYDKTNVLLPVKIMGLTQNPENLAAFKYVELDGAHATDAAKFLNVTVMINNHAYRPGTPGVAYNEYNPG